MDTPNPMLAFHCPKCGSDQTSKFSAVHEGGTSHIRTSSTHSGVALSGGSLVPVVGGSSTSGIQQSALARKCAPPELRRPFGIGCFTISVLIVAPIVAVVFMVGGSYVTAALSESTGVGAESFNPSRVLWVWFAIGLAIALVLAVAGLRKGAADKRWNANDYPRLRAEWDRKWLCLRCGHEFPHADA